MQAAEQAIQLQGDHKPASQSGKINTVVNGINNAHI